MITISYATLNKPWVSVAAFAIDSAVLVAFFALGWHYVVLGLALVFAGLHVVGSVPGGLRRFAR